MTALSLPFILLFNLFLTVIFSLTLILMGGCNSGGIGEDAPAGDDIPMVSNLNGVFKINGEKYSLSGICKEDGEVKYKIGANPEATASCTNGVWEVSDIVPTLDDGGGGSTAVSDGDKVPVKVSFVGSDGTVITVEGTFTIDRTAPVGGNVAIPASDTYPGGDLDFVVSFNEKVFVDVASGIPSLSLALETFGAGTSSAKYVSGSGTTELTFRYGIQGGDQDTDGVALSSSIQLNSGSIKDQAGNDASIASLSVPPLGGVKIATTEVTLKSVSAPDGSYGVGAALELEAVFSEAVSVTGVPRLKLVFAEGAPSSASYVRGDGSDTLIFSYTVSAGENDNNGIEVTGLTPASAGIVNQYGLAVAALSGLSLPSAVIVDTKAPELRGLTDMATGSAVSAKSWSWSCNDVSAPCSYRYTFNQQSSNHQFSESDVYGTDARADTPAGGNGVWYLHIQAKDSVNNESAVSSYGAMLDSTPPLLVREAIGIPTPNTYSNQLDFAVKFSENVTVETGSGGPRLTLTVGVVPKYANYHIGSGGRVLTFRYVIQVGDVDNNGIGLASVIDLNGGTIKDGAQNAFDATATLQLPLLTGVKVSRTLGVSISTSTLTVAENAGVGSYTVVLDSQPSGTVSIAVAGTAGASVNPTTLDFTTGSWSSAQTVTVTGVDDKIDSDRTSTITHTVSAPSTDYASVTAASVRVTLTDDDTRKIRVSTSTLTVAEDAGRATYTVVLDSQPTGAVSIAVAGTAGASVNPTILSFDASSWSSAQTVTVTGVDDKIDSDRTTTITHAVSASNTDYASETAASVLVTLTDDDTKGITVSAASPFTVAENAGEATYTVVLDSQPTGAVSIAVSSTTGASVDPTTLSFNASNWLNPITVTVTGVDDKIDSDRTSTITHTVSATNTDYASGVTADSVSVTLTDDDTKGITVSAESPLVVAENAGEATYTVVLDSQPTGAVSIAVSSTTGASVDPTTLSFNASNWLNPITVTVTGVDDKIDSDRTTTISHTVSATGTDYASGVTAASVSVTLTDDDERGITVSPEALIVTEAAGSTHTAIYTVKLNSQPTEGNVLVVVASADTNVATVPVGNAATLTFNSDNWETAQNVTVTGLDDDIDQAENADKTTTITHRSSGADYEGLDVVNLRVTVTDDDVTLGNVIITGGPLTLPENAGSATYTVALSARPSGNVTVTPSGVAGKVGVSGALTFTTNDWNTGKEVTVTGMNDNNVNTPNRTATIRHAIAGGGYTSASVPNVEVTLTDDDAGKVTVVITGPSGPQNGNIDFTVTFSQSVNGFAKGDITVSAGTLGTLTGGSNGVFSIRLIPPANIDAFVTVDIAANMAISVSGHIGNTAAVQYRVKADKKAPGIKQENITVPADGNYTVGQHFDFSVKFDEVVQVVGVPQLHIWMGTTFSSNNPNAFSTNREVLYQSGSGSATLIFRYTVAAASVNSEVDSDGITISDRRIHMVDSSTIKDILGNLFPSTAETPKSRFLVATRLLTGVTVNKTTKNNLALQDRVVSTLSAEQTPALAFNPAQIKGLARWLDGADSNTLFSDLFCSTPLGAGEGPPGCWSDKSGRGGHYFSVPAMEWPTLFDVLATEAERKSGELFAVTDREGKVNLLSFVYPHPLLEEETFHNLGEIREVVIYEEPLGESERSELKEYLTCRWQLPSTTENCL